MEEKQRQARSPNSWPFQGWGGGDDPGRFSGHQTGTGLQSQLYKVLPEVLPQPHWPPPVSSNKEKIEGPLAAGRSLAAQVALTASAIPNLDGGEISREGSPQPEAFVPLLWLGWPGSAAFSPPSGRVTQAFVLPAHTGRQSPPLSWQLLPRLAGTGGPGDTTGAREEGPHFSCSTFGTRQARATHTHTHKHTYFSASRPNAGPLVPEVSLLG